ncbi:MAG: hypothetical protein JKY50_00525 [Oleispira sp.]|nr:hypothetical protein [Oleispira sp.]
MLTGNVFLKMLDKPQLHIEQAKPAAKKTVKPRAKSIDKIISALGVNGMASRKWLIDNSGLSSFGVDRCIEHLLETGGLKRSFVRMSGPYEVYNYEIR